MTNSTIRQKVGRCPMCSSGTQQPLIKGLCNNHYWLSVRLKSAEKFQSKEFEEDGLTELVDKADAVFSKYIRLKACDANGIINCYICDNPIPYAESQNMHYIKRGNMFLRFDERNCRAGCKTCNEYKGGNYLEYSKKLEAEYKGITDILFMEGMIVYKFTRNELRQLIIDLSAKVDNLKIKI